MRLYRETASYRKGIKVEMVPGRRSHGRSERNVASTMGLEAGKPTIRFSDSLTWDERIEAIAHECMHLQLWYRYGLGVVGRRIPRYGNGEDVFHYFMTMRGDWVFLLGQVTNTAHHLILIDYLKNEYGIESHLHCRLLRHNFSIMAGESGKDAESRYAKGIIAFEYERLIGNLDGVIDTFCETEFFWKACQGAQDHFGGYSFQSIPSPTAYEEDILSLLEWLGYQKRDFLFLPREVLAPLEYGFNSGR